MLLRSKRRISPNEGALVTAGSGIEVVLPANRKKNENVSREITFLLACAALWAEKPEIVSQLVEWITARIKMDLDSFSQEENL